MDKLSELAERLDSVASGMRGYGLRAIAWNKSMDLRPSDLSEAARALRATLSGSSTSGADNGRS
jgi:hypothetical protein